MFTVARIVVPAISAAGKLIDGESTVPESPTSVCPTQVNPASNCHVVPPSVLLSISKLMDLVVSRRSVEFMLVAKITLPVRPEGTACEAEVYAPETVRLFTRVIVGIKFIISSFVSACSLRFCFLYFLYPPCSRRHTQDYKHIVPDAHRDIHGL